MFTTARSPMTDPTPASLALSAQGVVHRLFVHPGPVDSLEQAAKERGQRPEQVVRSLLFRLAADDYALVLVAGPAQIPWKALRAHFGRSRLSLASRDEVLARTGYEIGAVSPWGLPAPIPTLIDESVLRQSELSVGSGRRGTAILLTAEALEASLPGAQRVDLFGV